LTDFELVSGLAVAPEALHAASGAAFSDYLTGPMEMPFELWPNFLVRHGMDLSLSRVAVRDGTPVAFAMVAPRPTLRRWRVAGMGAIPAARGTGAAPALLDDLIARATEAGLAAVELECFAQNERAQRLYRGRGFEPRAELAGYDLAAEVALPPAPSQDVHDLPREQAFAWLDDAQRTIPDLPLPLTTTTLSATTRPVRFWQRGAALLAWSDTGEGPIMIHALIDRGTAQEDGRILVAAMRATRPGAAVTAPAVQRDDFCGAALRSLGFERQKFHQLMMVRALRS